MLLAPLVNGLMGVGANALAGECALAPRLPRSIRRLTVRHLRVGSARLSIVCQRSSDGNARDVHVDNHSGGAAITVCLGERRVRLRAGEDVHVTLSDGA
jgi:hypothetical protein